MFVRLSQYRFSRLGFAMPPRSASLVAFVCVLLVSFTSAAEPFRYPEGKYGQAELKYHDSIPVLVVAGTPEEMAVQGVKLLGKSPGRLLTYPNELLERVATPVGAKLLIPSMQKTG